MAVMPEEKNALPPRLDLRKSGMLKNPAVEERPADAPVFGRPGPVAAQPTIAPATPKPESGDLFPARKKETSRIPLPATLGVAKPAGDAPVAAAKPLLRMKSAPAPSMAAQPVAPKSPEDVAALSLEQAKRKTSRISLESVLAQPAEAAEAAPAGAPKTIRLKRPADAPAIHMSQDLSVLESKPAPAAALGKTARLDESLLAEPEPEGISPTKRKTIRLKRPGDVVGASTSSTTAEPSLRIALEEDTPKADEPSFIFSLCALAALVIACVVIYMLAAQGSPGLNLSWPGKIQML